ILHLERKFTSATETFIANQINGIKKYPHSVFTIEYLDNLDTSAEVYAPPKNAYLSTKILRSAHKKYFQKQLQIISPRIIHAHYLTDASMFHPLTKNLDLPKICSCYGYDVSVFPEKMKFFTRPYCHRVFDDYDLILAMTEEMENDLLKLGCPKEKLRVHYHGIDTKRFDTVRDYSLTNGKYNLLTIASLYPVKGHLTVLKAINELKESNPKIDIQYNLVGQGFYEAHLKNYVTSNGLTDIVHFHGAIRHGSKFNKFLERANVFLHPSITTPENDKEGIPGALVEAMASGLPVISTYHGGIPAVVEDRKTGFLVKEHDYLAVADKLRLLHESELLRIEIGSNAKRYTKERLDIFEKSKNLTALYEEAMNMHRTNRI
ncbi:MAG: glycosyltransferase, partial [Pricia sp.]